MSAPQDRTREIRQQLRGSVELITAEQWGQRRQFPGDPKKALDIYVSNRCCFAVHDGPDTFYPWFQFEPMTAYPRLEIAAVLAKVPPEIDGWSLLSWFEAPNHLLGGEKPSTAITTQAEQVIDAALRFYAEE